MTLSVAQQIAIEQERLAVLRLSVKGGPGSGNFGHAGRPGERGGSAAGGSGDTSTTFSSRAYHGTSSSYIQAIKKKGIVAKSSSGGDDWAKKHGYTVQTIKVAGQEVSVYVTNDLSQAENYAHIAAEMSGSNPAIVAIDVPSDAITMFKSDENDSLGFRFEGTIPPEWINWPETGRINWSHPEWYKSVETQRIFIVAMIQKPENQEPE